MNNLKSIYNKISHDYCEMRNNIVKKDISEINNEINNNEKINLATAIKVAFHRVIFIGYSKAEFRIRNGEVNELTSEKEALTPGKKEVAASLTEQLEAVQLLKEQQSKQIQNMQAYTDQQDTVRNKLQAKNNELSGRVKSLEKRLNEKQGRLNKKERQISNQSKRIEKLKKEQELESYKKKISSIENQSRNLQLSESDPYGIAYLNNCKEQLDKISEEYNKKYGNNLKKDSGLEKEVLYKINILRDKLSSIIKEIEEELDKKINNWVSNELENIKEEENNDYLKKIEAKKATRKKVHEEQIKLKKREQRVLRKARKENRKRGHRQLYRAKKKLKVVLKGSEKAFKEREERKHDRYLEILKNGEAAMYRNFARDKFKPVAAELEKVVKMREERKKAKAVESLVRLCEDKLKKKINLWTNTQLRTLYTAVKTVPPQELLKVMEGISSMWFLRAWKKRLRRERKESTTATLKFSRTERQQCIGTLPVTSSSQLLQNLRK